MGPEFEEPDLKEAEPEKKVDKVRGKVMMGRDGGGPTRPAAPQTSLDVYVHSVLLFGEKLLDGMLQFYGSLFDLTQKDRAKIFRNLGVRYSKRGEYAKAVELMKEWMRLEPSNPEASYFLAQTLASVGNYRSALGVLGKTLRLSPKHKSALYLKGTFHIKLKEYKEAAEAFQQFIVSHPRHDGAHYQLAISFDHTGELEKAIEAMERAVELDRQAVKYHQHLGFLYKQKGDHQKAASCFSSVMELELDEER